jgi:hypothetical protein
MAFTLQNDALLVALSHIYLRLRIQQLLAPIPLRFHLKFKLTLPISSTLEKYT